ncbi:MAG: hypothetical protein M1617_03510 [Actinobacteria bacterium]|nr:hypothetical protein [Actinomycetota bacterium]MCL5887356.1 hypothetical protein [Actinomycetota bacterium]
MLARVLAIAMAVILDAMHRKLIYVIALFAVVMMLAIPMLPSYGQGIVEGVFREVALALTYIFAMVIVVALSATRMPSEIERRTLYPVLARGVGRGEYIFGTWLGTIAVLAATLLALGVVTIVLGYFNYGELMPVLLSGVLAIWFEAGVIAAFCVLVATMAGPIVTSVAALAFLFAGHVRSVLLDPGTLLFTLYPSLDTFNVINPVAHGTGYSLFYGLTMLAFWAIYSAICLAVATFSFTRRDL